MTSSGSHDWDHLFTISFDDDLPPGQRWSTWSSVPRTLSHGPEPHPDWVVTADAAIDTELGIIKTGKEADVHLLERAVPDGDHQRPGQRCLMAAKRYRDLDHRLFRRDSAYTETRAVTRNSRDNRAVTRRTTYGRQVAAMQWADAEFDLLKRLWTAGVPVPYPVQIDGTEILMEYLELDGEPAPRLAQTRPDDDVVADWFDQVRAAMVTLAEHGWAHGDLSAYNLLAADDRVYVIDVPQVVDVVANPNGMDFLARDCRNIATWFTRQGHAVDAAALLADLCAALW